MEAAFADFYHLQANLNQLNLYQKWTWLAGQGFSPHLHHFQTTSAKLQRLIFCAMDIFTILFYQPIYNLLIVFYRLFGENLALAVVAVALISRLITIPVTARQIKMSAKSQEMNERLKEVKEKYKNNKEKQSEELMKVQSEYLPGQLAGCLPLIIQVILFISILNVLNNLLHVGVTGFNEVAYSFVAGFSEGQIINLSFLGVDLSKSAGNIGYSDVLAVAPYIILALLVALSQFGANRILLGKQKTKPDAPEGAKAKKSADEPMDFAEAMQRSTQQTMMIFPVLIGFMALNFPAGLSLYWTVQSGFVIIQQLVTDLYKRNNESL